MTFTPTAALNFYNVCKINLLLLNSLFGTVKLNKDDDLDKYSYFGYGIGFLDTCRTSSLPDGSGLGKNVIKFSADMSLSVHIQNKKKHILIFAKGQKDV